MCWFWHAASLGAVRDTTLILLLHLGIKMTMLQVLDKRLHHDGGMLSTAVSLSEELQRRSRFHAASCESVLFAVLRGSDCVHAFFPPSGHEFCVAPHLESYRPQNEHRNTHFQHCSVLDIVLDCILLHILRDGRSWSQRETSSKIPY